MLNLNEKSPGVNLEARRWMLDAEMRVIIHFVSASEDMRGRIST